MPPRERAADRGARTGRQIVARLCEELRTRRLATSLSQAAVAKALGISRSKYGRMERDKAPAVSVVELARALAVVGLELSGRAYPSGSPVRDQGHLSVLERFQALLHEALRWRTEVPFPNVGDMRSWDGLISGDGVLVGVECEMRPTDWQELDRRIHQKKRDGAVDHVILLMPDTRSNRLFIRDHATAIAAAFPIPGQDALAALRAGMDPGGDALILL
jgi:transcriptional regulator with XRE-family HTH domain